MNDEDKRAYANETPQNADHSEAQDLSGLEQLRRAVSSGEQAQVQSVLEGEHPADIADRLEQMSTEERAALVELAADSITPAILSELEDEVLEDVLPLLKASQISDALTELDSDDATQLIEELDDERREEVMAAMSPADRIELESSFAFDEETAGRLMQREFVAAPEFWTVGQTIDQIRAESAKGDDTLPDLFFNVYVVDQAFRPTAYVPISKLLQAKRETLLSDVSLPLIFEIPQDMDQEDIAYHFEKYHLISAPVVDPAGRLCGMITVDDIVNVIQDENKEDILALAGVNDAGLTDTAFSIVAARAPWLFINLLTAILASFVISAFDYAIASIVALAILMPIVASMGGNAGTQSLAVAVRALTERDLTRANAMRAVRREALAALFNGVIFAAVLAIVTYFWFKDYRLSIVIFVAMIINHIFAGLAGILVPLGLKRFGADPAVASSVFVTTVTDIVGFFAFLGIAAVFLL